MWFNQSLMPPNTAYLMLKTETIYKVDVPTLNSRHSFMQAFLTAIFAAYKAVFTSLSFFLTDIFASPV